MTDFHFIRPWWLCAFILLALALYLIKKLHISRSGWQQVIPKHLANKLIIGDNTTVPHSLLLPFFIGTLAIIALAGPTWEKQPQPLFNSQKGAVIMMDMSYSMYATDLAPNRLTRARFKAIDLLSQLKESDVGLIAYAVDSFVISPLTEDANNIKLLLPALSPDLMPVAGSNPLSAFVLADQMLTNAGHVKGTIYWLTDDADNSDIDDLNDLAKTFSHQVNILGIGTPKGAPIKMPSGELLKDNNGAIVLPTLPSKKLAGIAEKFKGYFSELAANSADIEYLIKNSHNANNEQKTKNENLKEGDQWQEAGPYLILLILPLVLRYFRRGYLLAIVLPFTFFVTSPQTAYAEQNDSANSDQIKPVKVENNRFWDNLWKTPDQQAQEKFNQQAFGQAAELFTDPVWQGSAYYRAGKYEQALEAFKQSKSTKALYNKGNSLAKLQRFDEAIQAYDEVLEREPDHKLAKKNKALLEKILDQQEQEQEQNDQSQQSNQDKQDQQQKDQQGEQSGEQENDNSQQQEQSNNNENSDAEKSDSSSEQQQDPQNQQNENSNRTDSESENEAEQNLENKGDNKEQQEQSAESLTENNDTTEQEAVSSAQLTEEQQAKEEEDQKHRQLLKKVTDDPYLLLRNKMRLEYQKRRHNNSGEQKKW